MKIKYFSLFIEIFETLFTYIYIRSLDHFYDIILIIIIILFMIFILWVEIKFRNL